MICRVNLLHAFAAAALALAQLPSRSSLAQEQTAATDVAPQAAAEPPPEPLSDDELQVLVARIALYPDELIAVISEASLYPLQIVEAQRFLDKAKTDKNLKPKESWDGSVVSLLNYPDVVKMMSDDLDWTQTFGDALTYQQKDVLIAIQQLRDKAVAAGAIKTDDKIKVEQSGDNVIIQSASPEIVYVPQYEPQMLYDPGYAIEPIGYYPDPYPSYWYPTATYFAGAVTGALFAAAVDWDDWGVWGGRWDGGDIDVDCNDCFNNRDFNGKLNFNDIDWKNVDRSKINIDRDKLNNIDRTELRNRVKADGRNDFRNKASEIRKERPAAKRDGPGKVSDVRKSSIEQGLKARAGDTPRVNRPAGNTPRVNRPAGDAPRANRPQGARKAAQRVDRPVGKKRPAARVDNRPKKPSGLGNPRAGKREAVASRRGGQSMGGGRGGRPQMSRGGGRGGGGHARRGGGGGRRR